MGAENSAFGIFAIATSIIALFFKREVSESEHPDVARVKRAHGNALENAVPFFAVAAIYASSAPGKNAALAYFGTFVAARLLHSVAYIWGKQPFRTIFYLIGTLAVIGMAVHVIRFYA